MTSEAIDSQKVGHCYLHIGTEKTGTTSIQHFMASNREALRGAGYLYPSSLNSPNHMALARYALDDDRVGDLRTPVGVEGAGAVARYRERVASQLRAEIASGPPPTALILSNEHCHSQVTNDSEVARLADLLRGVAQRVTVIVYLRPQHELALSKYSTHIKMGGRGLNPFPDTRDGLPLYYDYESLMKRWSDQFGPDNLRVRIFDRKEMVGGSLVDDIASIIGFDPAHFHPAPRKNESLSPEGLALLRALNEHVPRFVNGKHNPVYGVLVRQMEATFPGQGVVVRRGDAQGFMAAFLKGNEAVRAAYFPERAHLFDPDWEPYPANRPPRLDEIELSRAYADLWTATARGHGQVP